MTWQLVIFDCDGVLVDSEPISNRVMAEILAEDGLPMSAESCYEHFMGRTMSDCVRILATRFRHTFLHQCHKTLHLSFLFKVALDARL